MVKRPFVIVLMLSFNGKELLEEAISSYLDNDYSNFKFVLIDNGSCDGTQEFIKQNFPQIELLRLNKNLGYSGGFNAGLELAFNKYKSDYVLITNNDVKADRCIISSTIDVAEKNENAAFVTGKVYYYDNPDTFQSVGKGYDDKMWCSGHIGQKETDKGQYDCDREIPWCDDIFWLVNKKVYKKVGGYDTEYQFQSEDFEWQIRAKNNGFKIYYAHKAKLWHKDSMTIGKTSAFKSYYDYRNPFIIRMKYLSYEKWVFYYKVKKRSLLKLTVKCFLKLKFKYLIKSWAGFLSAIRWGIRNKKFKLFYLFK